MLIPAAAAAGQPRIRRGLTEAAPPPGPPEPAGPPWRTAGNELTRGGEVFKLKGINWNGVESDCRAVHGLWEHGLDHYLDVLVQHRFNAVRVPIPYEAMADPGISVKPECTTADRHYATVHDFLTSFLEKAWARRLFVLFDLHSVDGAITEAPWTPAVSEAQVVDAWGSFAQTYGAHPAVMGIEIRNEPHGAVSLPEFHRHCRAVIDRVGAAAPGFDGLFFVSGTTDSPVDGDRPPWGGTLEALPSRCEDDALCQLGMADRIVFCPHVYGPDVRGLETVAGEDDSTFERRFGFLREHPIFNGSAIVATEFGGHLRGSDGAYFDEWLAFMRRRHLPTNAFFWTFPPTSSDTGGLLGTDWATLDTVKLAFLHKLQPEPSRIGG